MEEKFPNVTTYPDYDGSIDTAYIKLNEEKSHHCKESPMDSDIILDFDSGDRIIGIEILCPINDVMKDEIKKLLEKQSLDAETIKSVMQQLPQ